MPFEEDDADAVDSVLEITGRHARPGVARPLPPREEPRAQPLSEEPRTPPLAQEQLPSSTRGPAPKEREEEDDTPRKPKRRSRVPLLVGALATAAAAGGFFLWSERQQAQEKPAAPKVASVRPASPKTPSAEVPSPAKAEELAPAAPEVAGDAGTPAVVVAGGPSPSTPEGTAVPASGTAPATPADSSSPETPEAPSAPQAPVTTRLQLFVLPPVEVSLDGKRLGRTPLAVPLAPGPYTLELTNPTKGVRTTRAITVLDKGTTKQRILLRKGTVQVRAPAGSRIFLNGRKAGPKLSLYEGEHQLVVTSGKERWEKSFTLEPRQRVTFDVAYEEP
ncbi:PEGA domain-containing protein [Archangium minus]|uniref:PEGA domain-containing protein n=1 Tax=Archangium minus TaxID=83450 RepID=A0ABY9WV15_9BACT|nr:PEGA domain-containing protein [Archangium minus]